MNSQNRDINHILLTMKLMCIFLVSLTNKIHQPSVLENIRKIRKKRKEGWNMKVSRSTV